MTPILSGQLALGINQLSGILWLMAGAVFITIAVTFKDRLLRQFGIAFLLLSLSRLITLVVVTYLNGHNTEPLANISFIALRGIASYLLIDGSINGSARYKETRTWLAVAIISSIILGAAQFSYSPHSHFGSSGVLDLGPMVFIGTVGFLFASFRFHRISLNGKTACHAYEVLSNLFILKSILILSMFLTDTGSTSSSVVLVADGATILLITVYGIILGFDRHRKRHDCDIQVRGE